MARLNEPPVSADSIDTLRRKLLRQNRDLAKANAVHLVRIRNIEADYARSLSDNLRLESRVIELEKELENNNARRIADHALDVRSRLEAQLLECMSVLAGLGQEPPTKRHASPRGRRSSRASLPPHSPPRRRPPRELLKETEGRAQDDGRLPTIVENKSYTRATMDREQILALCSEAADITDTADTTDSPELGPPPMSRFVDGEVADIGSPSRSTEHTEPEPAVYGSPVASPSPAPMPSPAPAVRSATKTEKAILVRPDPGPTIDNAEPEKSPPKETPILPPVVPHTVAKTGSKRKYSMGDEVQKSNQKGDEPSKPRDNADRPMIGRERQGGKTLKELASMRREARERMVAPVNPRKPLSAKSTNDDVTSPTKNSKAAAGESKVIVEKPKPRAARERAAQKIREAEIETDIGPSPIEVPVAPPSPPPPVVDVLPSTENVATEAALLTPASPEPTSRMSLSSVRDTPPPADISLHGETSRPSRRSRTAVSYAEPNLRDKMRRPTKELYDAVSGQTRYLQRSGSAKSDSATPEGVVMVKRESSDGDTWRQIPSATSISTSSPQRIASLEELTGNAQSTQPPSSTTKPDRKKRTSSMMSKSISETEEERSVRQAQGTSPDRVIGGRPTPSPDGEVDPYEFTSSTPGSDNSRIVELKENPMPARQSKSSRRLSSIMKEDFKLDGMETTERPKAGGSRKRASMVLPKRSRADVEGSEDSSFESVEGSDIQDAGSRVSMRRRRSMML